MGSEMRSSSSAIPAPGRRKGKEYKGFADCIEQSENNNKQYSMDPIEIEDIRNNPEKLDYMNAMEIKTLARNVGISTSGTKQDLITFLASPSFKGKSTVSKSIELPSSPSENNFKMDAQNLSSKHIHQIQHVISNVSENKRRKISRRKQMIEATIIEDALKCALDCNELPIETEEVIVRKESSSSILSKHKVLVQTDLAVESSEPWAMLAHKKPQNGWIPYNPRTMRFPPLNKDTNSIKLLSWNVNGLRALLKLESFSALQLAHQENFDVLCLQETKLQEKDVNAIKLNLIDGYDNSFWTCSVSKRGYSGTAIISRKKPISVTYGLGILEHDTEGRIVTVEFDTFYLINGYVPNSGDGLRRLAYRVEQWDPSLSNYMKELEKTKPVILTGDLNCAHEEIDIYDPVGNRRSAGFTNEERESFQKNYLSRGFVDTFRRQHPGVVAYTYWGYRHGGRKMNKGWRLDYFLASEIIADQIHESYILPQIGGSDHCPIGLVLKL